MIERGGIAEVIRERVLSESKPGYRRDDEKVALVIEGGAMAGVVAAGMALAVGKEILSAFDSIWGVSAGAAAAAFTLSGQREAVRIYYDVVNSLRFIDLKRIMLGKPMMDIAYLTDHVMKVIHPLDWKKIINHPIDLHVIVTEANQACAVDFHNFETQDDLLMAIQDSCRIPLVTGLPRVVDAETAYTDGGIATGGICLSEALAAGSTNVLVLRSRSEDQVESGQPTIVEYLGYIFLKDKYPKLAKAMLFSFKKRLRAALLTLEDAKENNPKIDSIALPAGISALPPFETKREVLVRGARLGYRSAAKKIRSILKK